MNDKDIHALESLEFLKNYNEYVFKNVFEQISKSPILDFGCGYGTFINYVNFQHDKLIYGYEVNKIALENLKKRNINVLPNLENEKLKFGTVVSMNVLEHIEDDVSTIKNLYEILEPGGKLILYLPHSSFLWSNLDVLVGHYRRYTKNDLKNKLVNAGFVVSYVRYFDLIGSFVLFLSKLFKVNLDFKKERLIFYDKYVFKYLKFIDLFSKKIFGKNILIVAHKVN